MKSSLYVTCGCAVAALLWTSPALAGPEWVEGAADGQDAGNTPDSAQITLGAGAVSLITGKLEGLAGPGVPDTEDIFVIQITEPTTFHATTATSPGNSEFESRLWLLDAGGFGLLGNQFAGSPAVGEGASGSTLGNSSNDGTDIVITEPGIYMICVSAAPSNPASGGQAIFDFQQFDEVSGPDGPGGGGVLGGWIDSPDGSGGNDGGGGAPAKGPHLGGDAGSGEPVGPFGINYSIFLSGTGFAAPPALPQDRGSSTEKGSLLMYSKVDIRWDAAGFLTQDTFISILNDYPEDVRVLMYFVNGDPPLEATLNERAHPGWNWVDNQILLTMNEPTYWSAVTGQPEGVSPFASALDPGFPPGRPDPETGGRMMRGFIYAWAVNADGEEIRWNHLAGKALVINYLRSAAWESNAWSFQTVDPLVDHGQPTGSPGVLNLDGLEYGAPFDQLLFQFQAVGSAAYSGPRLVTSNTDVTLHQVSADLRQETDGPLTTKAHYDVWNNNEVKFSGAYRCITCWDQTLLGDYGIPNHFILQNLQTDHGRARIDGRASQLCDLDFDPANNDDFPFPPGPGDNIDPRDVVSVNAALLGLVARQLTFDAVEVEWSGTNMTGLGAQAAQIQYDPLGGPPEAQAPEEWFDGVIERALGGDR